MNLENNSLYYDFEGVCDDEVFVFLHGWGMDSSAFNKIIALSKIKSYLKVDLFGFGKSNMPSDYFDTYEYAYQVFLLLKRLGINNIILVGHSFGGRLSILLSSVFSINVKRSYLCASAGLIRFSLSKFLKVKVYKIFKFLVAKKIISKNCLSCFGSDDYRNASIEMKGVLRRVVVQDLSLFLFKIKCKTVLVWDKKDDVTPFWICKRFDSSICNAEIKTLNCGQHFAIFYNDNKVANLIKE